MLSTSLGELSDKDIARLHGTIPELAERAGEENTDSDEEEEEEDDNDDDDDNDMNSFETASAESLQHKSSGAGVGDEQAVVSGAGVGDEQAVVSGAGVGDEQAVVSGAGVGDEQAVVSGAGVGDEQAVVSGAGDQVMGGAQVVLVPDASGVLDTNVTTTMQGSTADTAQSLAMDKDTSESNNTQVLGSFSITVIAGKKCNQLNNNSDAISSLLLTG
jgi:hypothetical protein